MVVCDRLVGEYVSVMALKNPNFESQAKLMLLQMFPVSMLESHDNPRVTIRFGPAHDRFHLQLAIDAKVDYHVSRDGGVLEVAPALSEYGVCGCHPREFLRRVR